MKLWINPFLNTFYEWGLDKYWVNKLSFLKFLDHGNQKGEQVAEIEEYIKERVPEWYWQNGFSWWIESGHYSEVLRCWEGGGPYQQHGKDEWMNYVLVEDFGTKRLEAAGGGIYVGYPEYLKSNGRMLELYPHTNHPYVQLINVGGEWFNSLFFTTEKGKTWCDVPLKLKFINWIVRNPMEVKE